MFESSSGHRVSALWLNLCRAVLVNGRGTTVFSTILMPISMPGALTFADNLKHQLFNGLRFQKNLASASVDYRAEFAWSTELRWSHLHGFLQDRIDNYDWDGRRAR